MGRRGVTLADGGRRRVGSHQGSRGTWCNDRDVGSSQGRRAIGAAIRGVLGRRTINQTHLAVRLAGSYLHVV
jgi:hypothetical protein